MRRFTYRRSLSLHPVTISGGRVRIVAIPGGAGAESTAPLVHKPVRVSPMPDLSTLAVFLHVNS